VDTERIDLNSDLNGQVTDWKFRSLLANYNANLMLHSSFTGCSSLVLMWNGGFCIVGWFNFFCMATLVISAWQLEVNSIVVVFFKSFYYYLGYNCRVWFDLGICRYGCYWGEGSFFFRDVF